MLERLNYRFDDQALLTAALTHRSASTPKTGPEDEAGETDNQRLEFLGDAVLELIVSEFLYHHEPRLTEGDMSRIRAALVCEARLAEVARRLRLGEAIILGAGEAHGGGRQKPSVLADALEALLGAVHLDGGFKAAAEVARRLWKPYLANPGAWADMLADFKTRLQEETQRHGQGAPVYELVDVEGPAHARFFTMAVSLSGEKLAKGAAGSKKEAEQLAAKEALALLVARKARPEKAAGHGDDND
ncbi:MAG: ribonuclease III [Candidatus Adiutrix sp.]|jgi:ribonuclease-3|nr:ribonuclease III [Candidatus Adiutrix sp.]